MNIDLLPKSRHMERRNGRCKFIGHSYVSLQHYLSKPLHFWIALFVVPCIHHSQECPPYVLKCVSPNPCRCFSTDGFHVWHSTSPPPWTFLPMSSQETGCKPNILVFLAQHIIFIQPSDPIHCLYSWQWNNCKKGKPRNLTFLLPIPPRFEHLLKDMDIICNQYHSKTEKN